MNGRMNEWKDGDWGYSETRIFKNPSIYVYVIDSCLDDVYATGAYVYDPETTYSVSLRTSSKLPKNAYTLETARQYAIEQVLRKVEAVRNSIVEERVSAYVFD